MTDAGATYLWKPLTEEDIPQVAALIRRVETHDQVKEVTSDERLAHEFEHDLADPAVDTAVAYDPDGTAVGLVWISKNRGGRFKHRAILSPWVHPDHRGGSLPDEVMRRGIGRSREILGAQPDDLPKLIRCWAGEKAVFQSALLERHGFEAVRYFFEMKRPLEGPVPDLPAPDGIEIVTWTREMDEDVRLTHNRAFADHWGSEPWEQENWNGHFAADPDFLPDSSYVALNGRDIVGYAMSSAYPDDFEMLGHTEAWTEALGVVSEWRRRGVASVLLSKSLRAFQEAGYQYGALGVDAASETGAVELYAALGYELWDRSATYTLTP